MNDKRRMPIRTHVATLKGDYAGWVVTLRTNIPLRTYENLVKFRTIAQKAQDTGQVDVDLICDTLKDVLVAPWNFVDAHGDPLGVPWDGEPLEGDPAGPWSAPTPEALREMDFDLLAAVLDAFGEAMSPGEA